MNPFPYHTLNITSDAKDIAKDIIAELNLVGYDGEVAFWLNFKVPSDYVAIAALVQDLMDAKDFVSTEQLVKQVIESMPAGLLRQTN